MDIQSKLETYADYQAQRDLVQLDKQALIDEILTDEIKAALAAIDAEFGDKLEAVNAKLQALEAEIKAEVVAHGATVKGTRIQAVYSKPRVSWDSKMLDGLAMVIPHLAEARKVGNPSVSFRAVG